jgi:choloylglycine hydrolase
LLPLNFSTKEVFVMRNFLAKSVFVGLVVVLAFSATNTYSCMSFRVTAKDGNVVIGRTMEFGVDSGWKIAVVPRNLQFTSPAPGGKKGLTWKNKYGYVAVVGWGLDTMVSDGMNEAGLSFGGLWYEPGLKYQEVAPGQEHLALAQTMSGAWILGNFSTIDELKQAVSQIKVFGYVVPELHMAPPAHGIIYDASGKALVMEFGDGKVNLYDNPLGILTNAPDFPWHLNYLRQFIGMSDENPKPKEMAGLKFISTGHGAGMIGLPGDLTPPSRFVRLGVTTHFADKPENVDKALNLSQHIVNAFDIVSGMVVERDPQGKVVAKETTQWASFRDLTSRIFYFRTYENLELRKIELKKLELVGDKVRFIEMSGGTGSVKDVTDTAK